jgi:hypothetical protein
MLFESVEIPEPVLEALQNEKLVIFAGAGVSMGEPANYPSFSQLAKDINKDTLRLPIQINEKNGREEWIENIDRFLGRLEDETAINVKKEACRLLSKEEAKPTILHQSLLKLFKTPNKLRLVTTNFDPLFNDYASELWETNTPEYYYAPALPLGHDFNGIVYLHGSVFKNEKHIVITDKDFGRAYLTEGWARNFLQAMFSEYTILFIGYSYNDPVIPYLTRGLPPRLNHSNFAFISEGENSERWESLRIQPIKYSNKNRHEALGLCLQSWVEHTQKGILDHERRIQEIVSLPSPPLDPKDLSYIENSLKDIVKVTHFTGHCNRTLDWLYWVNKQDIINELFQLSSPLSEISGRMSSWLAQYIVDYPEETLRFFQSKGNILNRKLWLLFFDKIWRTDSARMEPKIFLEWIIFLLNDCKMQYESSFINHIFEKCQYPDDKQAALLLFEYLSKPQWSTSDEICLVGDTYQLKEAWQKFFQPNLSAFSINLEPIVTNHLQKASWIVNSIYRDHENYCFLSSSRHTIEADEDLNGYRVRDVDILIDAARDILENLLIDHPDCAYGIIEKWNLSGIPILQRLAIHGISKNIQFASDEKIQWLILNKYIDNYYSFTNEIFRLLESSYSSSSTSIRLKLLEQIESFYYLKNIYTQDSLFNDNYDYFIFLENLYKLDPKCDLIGQKIKPFKQKFSDSQVQEYSVVQYSSLNITEVLGKSLEDPDTIDWLLSYDEKDGWGSRRHNLLTIVQKITSQNFDWSWQLSQSLKNKQEWNSDLWKEIFLGWNNSKFTEEQWQLMLTFLVESFHLYYIHLDLITNLLDTRQEQTEIIPSCFPLAKQLANNLWLVCEDYHKTIPDGLGWIEQAINNPSGKITLFWLRMLSKEPLNSEKLNISILDEYQRNFKKVLEGNYYAAELGRVMICTQLNFLFSLNPEWTQENIIPLFDWSKNPKQAQQAWHGFLWQGRPSHKTLSRLLPFYKQTFSYVSTNLNHHNVSIQFLNHIVSIVGYAPKSFFENEPQGKLSFIADFLKQVNSNIKKQFTLTIGSLIRNNKEDFIISFWNEWLKSYWEERNRARPVAVETGELEEMIKWLIYLKPVFDEAVDLFCESPISADNNLLNSHVIYQLEQNKDYAVLYPKALAKLILHLLKNTQQKSIYSFDYIEKIFRQLSNSNILCHELRQICDELSKLGYLNALKLEEILDL